jgi:succinate dehydrogenase/fumarate reductase cytochrome b subunit
MRNSNINDNLNFYKKIRFIIIIIIIIIILQLGFHQVAVDLTLIETRKGNNTKQSTYNKRGAHLFYYNTWLSLFSVANIAIYLLPSGDGITQPV